MEIRKVGVVGLGTMGAGIAQVSVQSGFETVGREVNDELAERGRATIERYLTRAVEKGRMSQEERDGALGRLTRRCSRSSSSSGTSSPSSIG